MTNCNHEVPIGGSDAESEVHAALVAETSHPLSDAWIANLWPEKATPEGRTEIRRGFDMLMDHLARSKPRPFPRHPELMASIVAEKAQLLPQRIEALRHGLAGLPAHWSKYQWRADDRDLFGERYVRFYGDDGHGMGRQAILAVCSGFKSYFGTLAHFIAAANPDTIRMLLAEREMLLQTLPQTSPALAKGGDAVRVDQGRNTRAESLPSVDDVAQVLFEKRQTSYLWDDAIEADAESDQGTLVSIVRDDAESVLKLFAALSTPTKEPASQTEGMGGDAVREAVRWSETTLLRYCNEAQAGRYPSDPREFERRVDAAFRTIRAALTPAETAEAVPVTPATEIKAWLIGDPATGQWIEVDGQRVEHSRGMGTPVVTLTEAFKSERARADAAVRERNIAHSERDDALKALEAAKETDALLPTLSRPIIGIESRTAQEVFDIMVDRVKTARKAATQMSTSA